MRLVFSGPSVTEGGPQADFFSTRAERDALSANASADVAHSSPQLL